MCFSKVDVDRTEPLLMVVNLDPHLAQEGRTWLDLWQLGLEGHGGPYLATDLLTDTTWTWQGPDNWVRLDPHAGDVAHVMRLHTGE